jgi:ABC-type multidrug transport system fused ATPase/permease subunit
VLILDERSRGVLAHGVLGRAAVLGSTTPTFASLARAWLDIGKSHARTRPIAALLERTARVDSGTEKVPALPALVTLDHVAFAYTPHGVTVIDDLVATWRPGEVLVITGPNGSGKSTVLTLLLGLAKPHSGSISIAGHDLQRIHPRVWRQRIGYLSQRPFLPDRVTVGDAMRLLAPDAEKEELERALMQMGLWPVLSIRSPGAPLDARVGSLSAGEKQRLALARVLARRSPLLLLDEPDANLDVDGLELLVMLLRELVPGRMIAVAAHSPRLIEAADRVLALGESPARVVSPAPLEPKPTALQPEGTRS